MTHMYDTLDTAIYLLPLAITLIAFTLLAWRAVR